jgi:uncharacterized protein YijF (DUF1287 family)
MISGTVWTAVIGCPAVWMISMMPHTMTKRRVDRLPRILMGLLAAIACLAGSQATAEDFGSRLARAALERTRHRVVYDGSYYRIAYPGGDVPVHVGVCTDVVIRSYRALGVDLQQAVHEDMTRHFAAYPSQRLWGLDRPDSNIDHRRVPNLKVFFARKGTVLPVSTRPDAYQAGDLVTWMLPGNLPHIGIVAERRTAAGVRPLIVHNIGAGPRLEDVLFRFPITGHYRCRPEDPGVPSEAATPRTTMARPTGDPS